MPGEQLQVGAKQIRVQTAREIRMRPGVLQTRRHVAFAFIFFGNRRFEILGLQPVHDGPRPVGIRPVRRLAQDEYELDVWQVRVDPLRSS
jgi:hypothetical protein